MLTETTCDFFLIPATDEKGRIERFRRIILTDSDVTMDALTDTMDQYTEPLASYFDKDSVSGYLSLPRDFGKDYTGTFRIERVVNILAGSCTEEQHLKTEAGTDWQVFTDLAVSATARYQRYSAYTTGRGNVVYIEECPKSSFVARVIEENGIARSSTSGPTTITLQGDYAAWKDIGIYPMSSQALITAFDNVNLETDTFDVYIFDLDNNLVEVDFKWTFRGL